MDTSTITATDIMTRHLAVTTPDAHVLDAVERLIAQRVSGLPVIDASGRFVGRFTEQTAIAALDLGHIRPVSLVAERLKRVSAAEFMNQQRMVLHAAQDVFESAGQLLANKASGAPVVDDKGELLGVFTEQSVMHVFIGLCWEQLPSSAVTAWLDRDEQRRISEDTGLDEILTRFQTTSFRRLMVLRGSKLVGQITRLDALQAALEHSRRPLVEYQVQSSADEQHMMKTTVDSWMLRETESTRENCDVLTIAQQFLRTSCRQIPVLDGERMSGQISRCDLIRAIQRFFPAESVGDGELPTLYLSSVNKRDAHAVVR